MCMKQRVKDIEHVICTNNGSTLFNLTSTLENKWNLGLKNENKLSALANTLRVRN